MLLHNSIRLVNLNTNTNRYHKYISVSYHVFDFSSSGRAGAHPKLISKREMCGTQKQREPNFGGCGRCWRFGFGFYCGMSESGVGRRTSVYMCRVLPKLMPDWVAPLLDPYCREITFWPARSCSSLKLRTFLSASLGPIDGLLKLEA